MTFYFVTRRQSLTFDFNVMLHLVMPFVWVGILLIESTLGHSLQVIAHVSAGNAGIHTKHLNFASTMGR